MKIRKMLLFSKAISVSYSFSVSIESFLEGMKKKRKKKEVLFTACLSIISGMI